MDRRILHVVAMLYVFFRTSLAATCATNFSSSTFVNDFGISASHESVKNKANDVFTVGWCAGINSGSSIQSTLDVDFKHPYGIKTIIVGSPTNRDSYPYPTNVLVKYIPNGGNAFVHFPLAEGKLEIKLIGPGSAQTSFSQAIAAKKLQFTIQSYNGEDACLRIDLVGCVENDLCSGVCQNGGLCMYEDTCQCTGGFIGNHCELSGCTPEPLGLANGAIKPDQITVSSEDPTNNKSELGNADGKKGWCPLPSDQHPWVTIKLDEPKAVSVLSFNWASHGPTQIMTEFELQYVAPVDSSKRFRTFATDIPSMNGTHIFAVSTSPVMVTDTIRILPTKSIGRSCFKLEISGCDPKTLCSVGWCLNNGSCMGQNVCRCPANFFGDRCEQTRNDIVHTDLTFVNITNNIIITTSTTFQFHITGNVVLQTLENKPVLIINGTNSCIQLGSTTGTPSCVTDVNHCTNGFTFIVDIKFISIVDNTYIVSSGGNVPGHTGVTLFYTSNTLHFIVSTTNSIWTLIVPYKPMLNVWQHFELTWHKNLGVELVVNGHSLGSNSRPAPQQATAVSLPLSIGCSNTNVYVNNHMQVTGILSWSIDRTDLVNAGIKDAPLKTPAATTDASTPSSPKATVSTSSLPYQQYNLTFLTITNNILITPSFNFTLHNKPTLELQNNSHAALVLNCSEEQYVELPDKGIPCLESLVNCKDGFTFTMKILFTTIEPALKTYILSSGGDVSGVSGMALYIHLNQLIFRVKQGFVHWTGRYDMAGIIKTNVWYNIEVSWDARKGILVTIDGQQVIKESAWTPSPSVDKSNPLLIGKAEDSNYTSCMKVRDMFTWTVHRDVLVDHGILQVLSLTTTGVSTTNTVTSLTSSTKTEHLAVTIESSTSLLVASTAMKTTTAKTGVLLGPICLHCRDLSHIYLCDGIKQCTTNQVCYVEKFITNTGHIRYNTGCLDNLDCLRSQGGIVKRSTECVSCCNSTLCNTNGCDSQGLPPRDQRGPLCYDCPYVSSMDECSIIKLCGQDEVCSIERHDWGGLYSRYTAKCHSKQCVSHTRSVQINQGLWLGPRSVPECQRCCGEDLCNDVCNVTSHTDSILPIIG